MRPRRSGRGKAVKIGRKAFAAARCVKDSVTPIGMLGWVFEQIGGFGFFDAMQRLQRNRSAYWDSATGTVVIFDPAHPDLGTAFPPDRGYIYFRDLL